MGNGYINQPGHGESQSQSQVVTDQEIRMRSALKIVTLALLCVTVYCLPGPDPGAYHFSKTVWVTEKGASSSALKIGESF